LKYEEKRVRDLGIGSDGLTLIHKENQIFRKFLSRQDVGGSKSAVLAIDLRLKHGMHRDSANLPTSVSKGRTLRCGVRYTRKNQKMASQ